MRNRAFKLFYRAHLLAGIFVSVHCLVLFLSGALLLFKDEIQNLNAQTLSVAEPTPVASQVFSAVLNDVRSRFPTDRVLSIAIDEKDPTALQVRSGLEGTRDFRGARRLIYDARTALERNGTTGRAEGFFTWLLELHRDLLMGSNGKLYVGFVGLVFLFTLASGFFIYGNFMKALSFAELRRATWRSLFADLHKLVGISLLFWALLIGTTGTLLAFNSTLLKIYQATELHALNEKYNRPPSGTAPLEQVIEAARAAKPGWDLSFIAFPDTQFSVPNQFILLFHGRQGLAQKLIELVVVDASTGVVSESRGLPLYLKTLVLSEPLHFGDYGGLPLKILWLVFSLVFLIMPVSGILILVERKKKRKPAMPSSPASSGRLPAPWSHPLLLPSVFFVLTAGAFMAALFGDGLVDGVAVAVGSAPLVFFVFLGTRRRGKHHE